MTKELKLFQLNVDFGRMGEIDGLFAAEQSEIDAAFGKRVYLGEALGKHSEVYFDLQEEMLTALDISSDAVRQIVNATGTSISGYNPLDYIDEEDEE